MPNKSERQDIHEQLVEKMKTAVLEAQEQDHYTPSFDWSFKEETQNDKSSKRFMRVAAIVIIFLLGANILLLSQPKNTAYSDQGILHRLYVGTIGLFTDSDSDVSPDDVKTTMVTDKWSDIEKFKRNIEQLHIPQYIPDGYRFVEFSAEEYYSGNCMGYYCFDNENGSSITLTFSYNGSVDDIYSNSVSGELIELEDRTLYITEDEMENNLYITIYTDDGNIDISGNCSKEELKNMAIGLSQ